MAFFHFFISWSALSFGEGVMFRTCLNAVFLSEGLSSPEMSNTWVTGWIITSLCFQIWQLWFRLKFSPVRSRESLRQMSKPVQSRDKSHRFNKAELENEPLLEQFCRSTRWLGRTGKVASVYVTTESAAAAAQRARLRVKGGKVPVCV